MAEDVPDEGVKASINNELQKHYQRQVDVYRPDLKEDKPSKCPIFHPLNPCNLIEQKEKDGRKIGVKDLLDTQLQEVDAKPRQLPKQLLLLGRPESGKTSLYALMLHYWIHNKDMVKHLKEFDFLLAVQCLGLQNLACDSTTPVNFERHILDHLPESINKYGEEVVKQTMRKAKVLIMIDSLDCLNENSSDSINNSLVPWTDSRVILFYRYKLVKDNPQNFNTEQSEDNLVLKLWGGMPVNMFDFNSNSEEDHHNLGGLFSGQLLKSYCNRLCESRAMDAKEVWEKCIKIMRYLSSDMRKPFNMYMVLEGFSKKIEFNVETSFQLYKFWVENSSKIFGTANCESDSKQSNNVTEEGFEILKKFAYQAFTSDPENQIHENDHGNAELELFLTQYLMPHYNPQGKIARFTFRLASHMLFFVAEELVTGTYFNDEEFKKYEPILPMIVANASLFKRYDIIKKQAIHHVRHNIEDHIAKGFPDPVINYAVTILSEISLPDTSNEFIKDIGKRLVEALQPENWTIVDGNIHSKALHTLFQCAEDNGRVPQRLNISLSGSPTDMPGLYEILQAVKDFDIRIKLTSFSSFHNDGEFPLDDAVSALQGRGKASLGSLCGYLKNVKKLDTDPATRRLYKISLRICDRKEYENLRELCKVSHKLHQVTLRISCTAAMTDKKLKELPSNISKLTVYLEGFSDENVDKAISIWMSIQGTAQREVKHLYFWKMTDEKIGLEKVREIIAADLPGTRIEVPLEQPVTNFEKADLQKELNRLKEDKYLIKCLGTVKYPRFDIRKHMHSK